MANIYGENEEYSDGPREIRISFCVNLDSTYDPRVATTNAKLNASYRSQIAVLWSLAVPWGLGMSHASFFLVFLWRREVGDRPITQECYP